MSYNTMHWRLLLLLCFCFWGWAAKAQPPSTLDKAEGALTAYVDSFYMDSLSYTQKLKAVHRFIPRFVATLKLEGSINHPFDKLKIMTTMPADSAFRIYTWFIADQLKNHNYYGCIQMAGEPFTIYPLFDFSDTLTFHTQQILSHENWFGAMYYKALVNQKSNGEKVYTLLGKDEGDFVSNTKVIETLTFSEESTPTFGQEPLFYYTDSNGVFTHANRRVYVTYSDRASVNLNYDPSMDIILFDHTEPPTKQEEGALFTYVPDGTYEGFRWEDGKWNWIDRVFTYSIGEPDNPPVPAPLFNKEERE